MKVKINVKCSYCVEREFDDVPEDVAKVLLEEGYVCEDSDTGEWLSDNIRERDCYAWEYEVLDAEVTERKEERL